MEYHCQWRIKFLEHQVRLIKKIDFHSLCPQKMLKLTLKFCISYKNLALLKLNFVILTLIILLRIWKTQFYSYMFMQKQIKWTIVVIPGELYQFVICLRLLAAINRHNVSERLLVRGLDQSNIPYTSCSRIRQSYRRDTFCMDTCVVNCADSIH